MSSHVLHSAVKTPMACSNDERALLLDLPLLQASDALNKGRELDYRMMAIVRFA